MPSHDHCCVPLCTSRRNKCPDVSFHIFPRSDPLRAQWIAAIRRDEGPSFHLSRHTVVCSKHFVSGDFVVPLQSTKREPADLLSSASPGAKRECRRLRSGSVPSLFSFREPKGEARPSPDQRRQVALVRVVESQRLASLPTFGPRTKVQSLESDVDDARQRIAELEHAVAVLKNETRLLRSQLLRFENVRLDEEALVYFTGVESKTWDALWNFVKPSSTNICSQRSAATDRNGRSRSLGAGRKSTLSLEDQLLMTLMRLRLGRMEGELGYVFGLSVSTVSKTIIMWLNFLYLRLGMLPIWPTWEAVEKSMPSAFRRAYPNTFGIIDATELFCETPSGLSLQSEHFSEYKSHTTVKGLVAIAPNGAFTFISQLYSGSISDRQLFERSGILPLLDTVPRGKSLMADRGFEVQDLLVRSGLLLNSPPFLGGRSSLSKEEVKKTQRIARLRIHIERAIGQVKAKFKIFRGPIPLVLYGSVNQMWTVCCLLSNFSGPLIRE